MTVAVLDVGKTHARLALFDGDRPGPVWSASNPMRADGPWPAEDVEALAPVVTGWLAEAARRGPLRCIVPVAHGAAGALVAGDRLAAPAMDYESDAPERTPGYEAARPPFAETLTPLLPNGLNLGRQLWHVAHVAPQAVARAEAFLALPQLWAWLLCGVAASEVTSMGAHGDLWAPREGRPSSFVRAQGWERLIPPLRRAWEPLGPIRPAIAAATGLDPATPVLCGIHDSNAALLPHLAAGAARVPVASTGTWAIVMHVGGDVGRLVPEDDMLGAVDALGRPTPTARAMLGREYAKIAGDDAPPDAAAAAAVIAAGAMALPSFSTQGGPWRARPGRIVGAPPERPGARSALASLYCALVCDDLLDRLGAEGTVFADGPLAANPVWMGAMAALRAPAAVVATEGGGPAAGAALLADWGRPRPPPEGAPARPLALDVTGYRARWRATLAADA